VAEAAVIGVPECPFGEAAKVVVLRKDPALTEPRCSRTAGST